MINLLNSSREVIDWIDCSPSTGLRLGTIVTLWSLGLFWWFFVPNRFYQKSLVRSFFLLIRHAFITNYMVVIIGASSLCRTLDSIPYKTKKLFVRSCFSVPGLSFNDKAINRQKIFKTFLLEDFSVKLTILLLGTARRHKQFNFAP